MKKTITVNILAFLTVLVWGSSFVFTKAIGDQMSPYALCSIRCIAAAVVILVIGLICGIRKPFSVVDLLLFLLSGVGGYSAYYLFYNLAMTTITSATGSIICSITPIFSTIAICRLYKEKINLIGWIAIICAFIGVLILILWNGVLSINTGVFWMFAAAIVFAVYNVLNRTFSEKGYTAMEVATYNTVMGAIPLLVFLPQDISAIASANLSSNLAALYLGIIATGIMSIVWFMAVNMSDKTSNVTNYLFVMPLISAILGFIMLHEVPDLGTYIGGVIIILSVVVFTVKGSPEDNG